MTHLPHRRGCQSLGISKIFAFVILLGVLYQSVGVAIASCNTGLPETTPTSDFTLDDVNGIAIHNKTGLTWDRCALGQTWDSVNKSCTGSATKHTWSEIQQLAATLNAANYLGFNDWRMPYLEELNSIVEQHCESPAINSTVFPGTDSAKFWSPRLSGNTLISTWVNFIDGSSISLIGGNIADDPSKERVRLVRGAFRQTQTVLSIAGPTMTSSFVNNEAIVLTATVSTPSGNTGFTGTVAFKKRSNTIVGCETQSLNASGQASCQITLSPAEGLLTFTAEFSGDINHDASSSTTNYRIEGPRCNTLIPESTPSADFNLDDSNGIATHLKTGLIWARCALGQTWDNATKTCTGNVSKYNWQDGLNQVIVANAAHYLGFSNWRLPNLKELSSIVEQRCSSPAVNEEVFPGVSTANGARFWSSSIFGPVTTGYIGFSDGVDGFEGPSRASRIRLVRGGQSFDSFDLLAPVNGTCGVVHSSTQTTTPALLLCGIGAASSVTVGNTDYTWNCAGSNGGTTANCAATRNYVVSSSVTGGHGGISASQNVAFNATPTFTLTPDAGFAVASVGGTCGGSRNGNNFTTNAVTANCTVIASFTAVPVNGTCGSNNGQTLMSTPTNLCNVGSASSVTNGANNFTWRCAGSNGGTTANCSANRFISTTSHTGPTTTGTGQATIAVSGGGQNCSFGSASQFFVPVSNPLAGVSFPQGLVSFSLTSCTTGGTVNVMISYPDTLPAGAQYWKYGPTTGNTTPHWYTIPATISGSTVSFTLTDGGVGDDDLTANGVIVDPSGPGVAVVAVNTGSGSTAIPTLTEWAMLLLVSVLGLFGAVRVRRS